MAVLAHTDWQPPREPSPAPSSRSMEPRMHPSSSSSMDPRIHPPSSVSPDTAPPPPPSPRASPSPAQQPQPPPLPPSSTSYPAQQPWQPSPQAPAFYPAYPSYFSQPHPQPGPYFDPNHQFAQWAYQQMLFNAQAQAQFHAQQQQQQQQHPVALAPPPPPAHQRTRSSTPPQQPEFYRSGGDQHAFHPYAAPPRRPARQSSAAPAVEAQPPYGRTDAAGSSSSLTSGSSARSRKGSNPSAPPAQDVRRPAKPSPLAQTTYGPRPTSSGTIRPASPPTPRQSTSHAKRLSISKDDSQLPDPVAAPSASMVRAGGLKGRLRRALSFNAASALDESSDADDGKLNSRRKALANASKLNAAATAAAAAAPAPRNDDDGSPPASPTTPTAPAPPPPAASSIKGKSRARRAASLFNTKLNASTDNISLSSTVSSASVMIRKLGSMGRLARKNSLMGITSLFKDKDKDKDGTGGKDKGKKGATAVASVTHATAEVDRAGSGSDGPEVSGLSPAARLARQHTIRSNEEAARQKAAEEARARDAAAAAASTAGGVGGAPVPVWERGTAPRSARRGVIREDDDGEEAPGSGGDASDSDSGSEDGTYEAAHRERGWDDDDEDVTIRVGGPVPQSHPHGEEDDPWAVGLRRSIERARRPAKGILKNASSYDQESLLAQAPNASFTRVRSNSYNQSPHNHNEPGPLARIPSPDPDHIDGLYPHTRPNGTSTAPGDAQTFIPPFTFEDAPHTPSSDRSTPSPQPGPATAHGPPHGFFNLANMNSSAPALSTMHGHPAPPPLTHRAATTPAKRLAFAAHLSIYDTFSPHVYDRRSEPATCNRLTPALAQRIKEELNSYKMEEMEVHAASRVHTQFFV